MNRPLECLAKAADHRRTASAPARLAVLALFCIFLLASSAGARAQALWAEARSVRSVSGQFVVTVAPEESPLLHRADLAADTNYVRLEPALLAVSAERFKYSLWTLLGLPADGGWSGRIFLALHPAATPNDAVTINIGPLEEVWNYHVEMPDVVTRTRYARALTATLLLEIANRQNLDAGHSAELPPWLTDGLAREVLGRTAAKTMLSLPGGKTDGVVESRVISKNEGLDPLGPSRQTLRQVSALTFDELCWPTDAQMNGEDGGAYLASAQLFVDSLLGLDKGAEKLRDLLARLPHCMNWQTAFYAAFAADFRRPLEVEKWWTLRVIHFAARDPGARWTVEASRERLADLLAVPVEFRRNETDLPEHTVVSLQDAIQNFSSAQLDAILEIKRRDFELAQFHMAPPFAGLADGYRAAIADYLGEGRKYAQIRQTGRFATPVRQGASVTLTVSRLDALDARRRTEEDKLDTPTLPKIAVPALP